MPNLSCRFYERKFPKIDEVVMATVLSIAEMGAYVHLLEYNKIEGMILLSELSRRRIRSINKLIRVGKDECVVVIRVDEDKGYIDLSKRRVSPEEVHGCYAKFSNAKCVNSILCHVGQLLKYETDAQLEELYKKTAWMFDKKFKKDGASFDSFKKAVMNPSILDECDIDAETKEVLLENIKRRLTPHAVKIRSDVEVLCYEYEGVDAVKRALGAGIDLSTADMPIKINLIAPPLYVVTTQTLDRGLGVKRVEEALVKIKESIEKEGGKFSVKMQPKVVSDVDELELAERMEKLKKANEEVSGDEDSEEETGDEEEEEEDDAAAAAAAVAASGGIDGGDEASKEGEESK